MPFLCITGNLAFSPGDTAAFLSGRLRSWHCFRKVLFLERESSDRQGGHLPSQCDQLALFGVCPWLLWLKENLFWNREDSAVLDKLPAYQGAQQRSSASKMRHLVYKLLISGSLLDLLPLCRAWGNFLQALYYPAQSHAWSQPYTTCSKKKNLLGMIRYVRNFGNDPSPELSLNLCRSLHAPLQNVLCGHPTEAETKVSESSDLW